MQRVFVLNGPNLNWLGKRRQGIYPDLSYSELEAFIAAQAEELSLDAVIMQTNHEGEAIDFIQRCHDCRAGVCNLGAWTHYNYSLRDALLDFAKPIVEVHMSHVFNRELFRQRSVIADVAYGLVSGFGIASYTYALMAVKNNLQSH